MTIIKQIIHKNDGKGLSHKTPFGNLQDNQHFSSEFLCLKNPVLGL